MIEKKDLTLAQKNALRSLIFATKIFLGLLVVDYLWAECISFLAEQLNEIKREDL